MNSQTSAIAVGASAGGLSIPTAMVKAMPVFRYFDYGHNTKFVQGKKGIHPRPVWLWYILEINSLLTSLQPK